MEYSENDFEKQSENPEKKSFVSAIIRKGVKSFADLYFGPWPCEKNISMYRYLGVPYFERGMFKFYDFISKGEYSRMGRGNPNRFRSINILNQEVAFTKSLEVVHLGYTSANVVILAYSAIESWPVILGLNTVVNTYPILLQRYNRARFVNLAERINLNSTKQLNY